MLLDVRSPPGKTEALLEQQSLRGVPTWVSGEKPHLAPGTQALRLQESYALNFPKHGWDTLTQSL